MAQMNFGTRPPLLQQATTLPIDPNAPPTGGRTRQMYATPRGRPPTDFGGVQGGDFNRMAPRQPPNPTVTTAPAVNDLAPTGTMATAPRPMGGMTATGGMRPYDPNRRFRDPGNR
jgi:hypothetical protein